MHRLLLIHPEERDGLAQRDRLALLRILNDSGFTAAAAALGGLADGAAMLCHAFGGRPPHVLVMDMTSPATMAAGMLPLRHLQRIQREGWGEETPPLPCVALIAAAHLGQRDLPLYVDDFLLPPHAPDELVARVRLLLFRRQHIESANTVRFHDLTLDLAGGRAFTRDGNAVPLTPREYDLLRFLLTHRGKLFSRERLLALVWGVEYDGGARTVDIHVRRLRTKLPLEAAARLENRRGVGYGFTAAPLPSAAH
jgi:DNA-binding response OmpR family regulator